MSDSSVKTVHPGLWVPTLYIAEGLPFVLVNVVSVLMYKSMGRSDGEIAFFTTLVSWPWMLKPVWGPLLEMFKTKKYFVIATQFIGGVLFGLLALSLQLPGFFQWSLVLFAIIAFNFATHDIAADGVYVNVLTDKLQSQYVGWQGAFYNVGKILSQGVLVIIAGKLEATLGAATAWGIVMGIIGIFLAALSLYHLKFLPSGGATKNVISFTDATSTFGDVVKTFFQKKNIWWAIIFLIFYRFAEGQAIKVFPLFMRAGREHGGLGLSTEEIGMLYGFFPPFAFILGSVLSGYFTANRGLKRSLFTLCCFFNIPFAVYTFLAIAQPTNFYVIESAIVFEYFGYGFGFIGLTLFMMQQVAPGKYKTAHYAFATALMAVGFNIPSMVSGFVSDFLGYKDFFIWVIIATIPSFAVTWLVPFRENEEEIPITE